ncbi:CopG family transcriptional regulator [Alkalibacillus aidingensis]|uniref:CopG family transcriptional regulator n=1 Tax=Alkalibacillus aidingensis TaxID=2747607 RepID=UPI0016605A6D|nr:CopG family transcriptional regulator [Alkalibacillus aidingensis]
MSKKKLSITVQEDLHKQVEKRANQLGISKSAFVAFASSYFLNQLEHLEKTTKGYDINVYELLKNNMEMQKETSE